MIFIIHSVANPDLESETSETTEILFKRGLENGAFGISLYQTDVENLIAWAPLPSGSLVAAER